LVSRSFSRPYDIDFTIPIPPLPITVNVNDDDDDNAADDDKACWFVGIRTSVLARQLLAVECEQLLAVVRYYTTRKTGLYETILMTYRVDLVNDTQ